jgi:hypothetical protein
MGHQIRFKAIGHCIENGDIKSIEDLFKFVPMAVLARELDLHSLTVRKRCFGRDGFTIREMILLSELFGISPDIFFQFLMKIEEDQMNAGRKKPPENGDGVNLYIST